MLGARVSFSWLLGVLTPCQLKGTFENRQIPSLHLSSSTYREVRAALSETATSYEAHWWKMCLDFHPDTHLPPPPAIVGSRVFGSTRCRKISPRLLKH